MPGRLACRKEGRLREAQRPERARALADEARVRAPHSARWLRAARARRRRLAGLALLALPPSLPQCRCVRAARANGCAEPLARPEAAATGAQEPRRPRALGARRDALGASTSNFSPIGLPGARSPAREVALADGCELGADHHPADVVHVRALIPARWLRAARARRRHLAGLALLALSPPPLYRPRVCEQRVRISARLALAAAEPTAVAVAKPRCPSARVAARVVTSVAFFYSLRE